jgi:signal transduction histidine kinase
LSSTDSVRALPIAPAEAARARNWRLIPVAALTVVVLEPFYWALDRVLIADAIGVTIAVRVSLFVIGALVLLVSRKPPAWLRPHDVAVSVGLGLAVAWAMTTLVAFDGGFESEYFVGLMFVMISVALLFRWSGRTLALFYAAALGPYFAPLFVGAWKINSAAAISHVGYILTTTFVAVYAQRNRARLETESDSAARKLYEAYGELASARDRLEVANVKLRDADRVKTQFFNNITHELRTPLTLVMSPLQELRDGEAHLPAELRSYVDGMWRNAVRLLKLITDLLDLAKLEESHLRLRLGIVNPVTVLEDLVTRTESMASRKDIDLTIDAQPPPSDLYADEDMLERVLVNLLANALKFTSEGGTVGLSCVTQPDCVEIRVTDNGIGIAEDYLPSIFERFTQADQSASRNFGGTGIGLALAKEIVDLHNGTIDVESEEGVGTTFTVRLVRGTEHFAPDAIERRQCNPTDSNQVRREEDGGAAEWSKSLTELEDYRLYGLDEATERRVLSNRDDEGKPTKVLIVEDTVEIIRFVTQLLNEEHAVYTATDGAMGLELARREKPDLIVTDYMMPVMNGVQMIEAIRNDATIAETPIVMLTGRNEVEHRETAYGKGADVYMAKPFSPKELRTVVRNELIKRGRQVRTIIRAQKRSLEQVSAGLAHEIHNPLTYIRSTAQLVAETIAKAMTIIEDEQLSTEERAKKLQKAADRMHRLQKATDSGVLRIQGVVDILHRYSREGFPNTASLVPIDETLADLAKLVSSRGETEEIDVELELGAPHVYVRTLSDEIQQAFRNLIQNAIDASVAGDKVFVRSAVFGAELIIRVVDSGCGISREDLVRVFTPFYTTTGEGQGMGVGLSISQSAIENAGGTLDAASAVGKGTTMTVRLPALGADGSALRVTARIVPGP